MRRSAMAVEEDEEDGSVDGLLGDAEEDEDDSYRFAKAGEATGLDAAWIDLDKVFCSARRMVSESIEMYR